MGSRNPALGRLMGARWASDALPTDDEHPRGEASPGSTLAWV